MYDEIFKLIQNGELNKAQEQLENTPENDPKRYNISGLIYYQKKEFDKAKEEFEKGLKINPVDSDLLFNYGYLLKNIDQEKEAWRYLMRIHNKDWATYDMLGNIEFKNSSKLSALRFYKKAAELPNSPNEMKKKFIDMRNIVKQDTKIAFLCLPGLDNFLKDIVETFSLGYDVKLVVTTDGNQISEAIKWADIVWLEWANDLAVFATNQIPEIQNKKVVCRLHRYEAFTQFPDKINWKNVDFLIFVAESMKKTFHELHPNINLNSCKEEIVYNGVDLDKFKFLVHKPGYNLSVLAHINYRKNPETWVQIIGKLKEIDNRYKLHVGGDFQDPLYKIYFDYIKKEMNLENNFILHGWINEVDKFLEDKDYTLSTSIHESFGYNIAEAMARGIKPIIHNFDGAKSLWPSELIYNTIDEAVEKITEESYDSESYRRFIEDNYSLEEQIYEVEKICYIPRYFNSSKITSDYMVKSQNHFHQFLNDPLLFIKKENIKTINKKFILENMQDEFKSFLEAYFNGYGNEAIYINRLKLWKFLYDNSFFKYNNLEDFIIDFNNFFSYESRKFQNKEKKEIKLMKKNFNKHLSVKVVKKLEEQINYYNLMNEFTFFVVHGSIADETYTGFSDLDTFVCISNESFNNSKRIKTLRNFFSNSYKKFILKEVDPTQHHGFFIIPEHFLEFYPESYMPLDTLLRGSELIKEQQILFSLRDSKYSLLKSIFSLSSYFIQIEENNVLLQNPFDIKRYISRFFMLPVLYNEYFENSFKYKKLVLEKLSSEKEFPGTFLIDIFSNIRNNWNRYEETNLNYILGKPITREAQEYSQKLLNLVMQEQNILEEIIYE